MRQEIRRAIHALRRIIRPDTPSTPPAEAPSSSLPSAVITTLEDLDAELDAVAQAFQRSEQQGRDRLAQICFLLRGDFPSDPYSPEYAQAQLEYYHQLSGRASYHAASNERTHFDVDSAARRPFPYSTQSAAIVSDQLLAQGYLIRTMSLPTGARIVEFGAGWGNLTIQLAQMGYQVTAVDVEPNFTELIQRRAAALCVAITVVQQQMLEFEPTEQYDAAIFFESFHHCTDHLRMLNRLHAILRPDGQVFFAAEPIIDFPLPWGFVRADGLALWSIRRMGWFELGFDNSYFLRTLLRFGWSPHRHTNGVSHYTDVIAARKSHGYYDLASLSLPPDEAATWHAPEPSHRFTSAHSTMSCDQRMSVAGVELCLSNPAPFALLLTIGAGSTIQQVELPAHTEQATYHVTVRGWQGQLRLSSPTWVPAQVLGSTDQRALGVAVHWLRLLGSEG